MQFIEKNSTKSVKECMERCMAWGIIPLAYLSWCFSTISYNSAMFSAISALVGIVSALIYGFIAHLHLTKDDKYAQELKICNWIVLLGSIVVLIVISKQLIGVSRICSWIAVGAWSITTVYLIKKFWSGVKIYLFSHKLLLLLVAAIILVALDNPIQFKWDGMLYYSAVEEANISSISSVALYGHIAMFSGTVMKVFAVICGNTGLGMFVANVLVLIVSTIAFYGIITTVVKDRKEFEYVLATAVYAFSPYLSGMVGYYSIDYYCICMTTVLVYCVLNRKWILTILSACAYCLTKEPALISYCGLCFGLVLYDLLSIKGTFKEKMTTILSSVHYYFMLIPIVLWLCTYKILGGWSAGNGGFGIDLKYIFQKLMVFSVFNWSWIFSLALLVGIIYMCIRRDKLHIWWLIPLVSSNISLLLFNCAFKTVNHPRYIDSFVVINYIVAIISILHIVKNSYVRNIVMVCLALVQIAACYITFDPITLSICDSIDVGGSKLATTYPHFLGDGVIYNKQALWMEKALCDAMDDALNEKSYIVFVANEGATNIYDGMSDYSLQNENLICEDAYWDKQEKVRVNPFDNRINDSVVEKIPVFHAMSEISIDLSTVGDCVSVIYIKGVNDYTKPTDMRLLESVDYSSRGWTVTRDIYTKD